MAMKPRSVLEMGTHIGASTLHIARALLRVNQNGKLTSVDMADVNHPEHGPWRQLGLAKSPREFARELGCIERMEFLTESAIDLMRTTKCRFDFIFLDGDHSARSVYQEVAAALSILDEGGIVLLHDYYPGARGLYPEGALILGPFYALDRIQKENPMIGVLPPGALPWLTTQGKRNTTLALVVSLAEKTANQRPSETLP
jgi:predicted O-methyltransferase YrrM